MKTKGTLIDIESRIDRDGGEDVRSWASQVRRIMGERSTRLSCRRVLGDAARRDDDARRRRLAGLRSASICGTTTIIDIENRGGRTIASWARRLRQRAAPSGLQRGRAQDAIGAPAQCWNRRGAGGGVRRRGALEPTAFGDGRRGGRWRRGGGRRTRQAARGRRRSAASVRLTPSRMSGMAEAMRRRANGGGRQAAVAGAPPRSTPPRWTGTRNDEGVLLDASWGFDGERALAQWQDGPGVDLGDATEEALWCAVNGEWRGLRLDDRRRCSAAAGVRRSFDAERGPLPSTSVEKGAREARPDRARPGLGSPSSGPRRATRGCCSNYSARLFASNTTSAAPAR